MSYLDDTPKQYDGGHIGAGSILARIMSTRSLLGRGSEREDQTSSVYSTRFNIQTRDDPVSSCYIQSVD